MNKKELISRVSDVLRDNNIRKPIAAKKHVFRISDSEGNTANFVVKQKEKTVMYTTDDISTIIDAYIAVVIDSIKRGEEVAIRGFGTLGLHKRAARRTKAPGTEDWYEIEGHYVPKFFFGNELRAAAKVYETSLDEKYALMEDSDFEGGDE